MTTSELTGTEADLDTWSEVNEDRYRVAGGGIRGKRPHGHAPAPGLQRAGARLPLDEYTRRLWDRRWFVVAYSSASNSVGYERSFLGQAWQLLTPMLNIVVYYLIFGLLLHTNRGVP